MSTETCGDKFHISYFVTDNGCFPARDTKSFHWPMSFLDDH